MSSGEMSQAYELKTDPEVFQASFEGKRPWEIRFNDRDFKVGDRVIARETRFTGKEMAEGKPLEWTGRSYRGTIEYILQGAIYGLGDGWVIFTLAID